MANRYEMLCADLDETLLVNFHVPEVNKKAIAQMIEKGYKFTIASGRPYFLIEDILKEINLDNRKDQYTIALNGATIYQNDGKLLFEHALSFKQVDFLYELSLKYQTGFSFFLKDHLYLINPIPSELLRRKSQKANYSIVDGLEKYRDMTIYKCLLVDDDIDKLRQIGKQHAHEFEEMKIEFSFSSNRYLECNDAGVNKGAGVLYLTEHLGLDLSKVVAIGDNSNDVPMLKVAGLGVSVANGSIDAKKSSAIILKERFDEGAVAKLIDERFLD